MDIFYLNLSSPDPPHLRIVFHHLFQNLFFLSLFNTGCLLVTQPALKEMQSKNSKQPDPNQLPNLNQKVDVRPLVGVWPLVDVNSVVEVWLLGVFALHFLQCLVCQILNINQWPDLNQWLDHTLSSATECCLIEELLHS